jgi:hypothetical protein
MYLRKAVLDHLPISMIKKTGTPARYMAIAAPERMDLVPISDLRNLSGYIDDLTLVFHERDWRILVCSLVR